MAKMKEHTIINKRLLFHIVNSLHISLRGFFWLLTLVNMPFKHIYFVG